MVNTRSPSITDSLPVSDFAIGAVIISGKAEGLAHRTATSFSGSNANTVAETFLFGSNCTEIKSDGPTTCWLVTMRPALSTQNPVPLPISLQTVTTAF